MNTRRTLATSALLALLLAGCGTTIEGEGDSAASSPSTTTPSRGYTYTASNTTPPTSDPYTEQQPPGGALVVGKTFRWDDGLAAKVSAPTPYKPDPYAASDGDVHKDRPVVSTTITLANGSSQPWDPASIIVTAASGGEEAVEVFDNHLGDYPSTTLLPGRSTTFRLAFAVKDAQDLAVEVTPDFEHESALWTTLPE